MPSKYYLRRGMVVGGASRCIPVLRIFLLPSHDAPFHHENEQFEDASSTESHFIICPPLRPSPNTRSLRRNCWRCCSHPRSLPHASVGSSRTNPFSLGTRHWNHRWRVLSLDAAHFMAHGLAKSQNQTYMGISKRPTLPLDCVGRYDHVSCSPNAHSISHGLSGDHLYRRLDLWFLLPHLSCRQSC